RAVAGQRQDPGEVGRGLLPAPEAGAGGAPQPEQGPVRRLLVHQPVEVPGGGEPLLLPEAVLGLGPLPQPGPLLQPLPAGLAPAGLLLLGLPEVDLAPRRRQPPAVAAERQAVDDV